MPSIAMCIATWRLLIAPRIRDANQMADDLKMLAAALKEEGADGFVMERVERCESHVERLQYDLGRVIPEMDEQLQREALIESIRQEREASDA